MNGPDKMHTKTQNDPKTAFEHAWKIHSYLTTYIQLADSKAGAIIALCALSVPLLTFVTSKILTWQKLLLGGASVVLVVSLILSLLVILPRTNNKSKEGLIFWENIRSYEHYAEYQKAFSTTEPLEDVLKHNYYLAEVAVRKYRQLDPAMRWQLFGLPVFWIAILITRLT